MCKSCGLYCCVFCFYAVQIYVLPHLTGILNFLVLFTTGFFCRILPSVAIAAYAVKTTTVSELISGMERIHMPKEVTIPLTVMFRFFPTVFQESEAISDAMKMRGIKLGGKNLQKYWSISWSRWLPAPWKSVRNFPLRQLPVASALLSNAQTFASLNSILPMWCWSCFVAL